MEEFASEEKPKKILDTGLLVGLCAIFISVATLAVYIYQARIMQSQQHASVWPYVEWGTSNIDRFYLEVYNKGIGPALIKNVTFKIDGKSTNELNELFDMILGHNREKFSIITSYSIGRVMAPGESFKIFDIPNKLHAHKVDSAISAHEMELEICYCSIYNDCWTTKVLGKVVESECQ